MKKSIYRLILVSTISVASSVSPVFAAKSADAVPLGNKYFCDGKTVYNGSRKTAVAAANTTIDNLIRLDQSKIAPIKNSKKAKDKAKVTSLKSKISSLKTTKKLIKQCSKGSLNGSNGSNPAVATAEKIVGNYSGPISGTSVAGSLSGTATLALALDGTVLNGSIGVSAFGGLFNSGSVPFSHDLSNLGLPIVITAPATKLGNLTITIFENGDINIDAAGVNKNVFIATIDSIQFRSTFSAGSFAGTLKMFNASSTTLADATFSLAKQ